MNRLVIVGNGFDLAHKMKTSYKDFLFWLIKEHLLEVFRREIRDGYYQGDDLRVFISDRSIGDTVRDLRQFSDFEDHIKFTSSTEIHELRQLTPANRQHKVSGKILINITNAYLKSILNGDYDKWVDLEWNYFQGLVSLVKESSANNTAIVQYQKDFENIKSWLKLYLSDLETASKSDIIGGVINKTKTFDSFNGRKLPQNYNIQLFLNFNYTSTLSIYVEDSGSHKKVLHIHGSLNDSEIVFGFGDENEQSYGILESLNNNLLLQNSKSIKYLLNNRYSQLTGFMNDPFEVEILGHSCGITDRTLLKMIFESENCVRIIPYYFVDENGNDNYSEIVTNISRNFSDKYLFRKKVVDRTMCQKIPQL